MSDSTFRVLVAPTAFKGTYTPMDAADAIASGWRKVRPDDEIVPLPVADGGDGTVEVLAARHGGRWLRTDVRRPHGEVARAYALVLPNGDAVMEMAAASGLVIVPEGARSPLTLDTRGTGELIDLCLQHVDGRVYVGLGGSATVDGGAGCAHSLGVRFADVSGNDLEPFPAALEALATIDFAGRRGGTDRVVALADVTNPLLGPDGAAVVYGPQKGASPLDVGRLERVLEKLAVASGRPEVAEFPGAGAAGGLGFGISALLEGRIVPGADRILELLEVESELERADLVITGEGRLDDQTARGKAPAAVARWAAERDVPVFGIVGMDALGPDRWHEIGMDRVEASGDGTLSEAAARLADSL